MAGFGALPTRAGRRAAFRWPVRTKASCNSRSPPSRMPAGICGREKRAACRLLAIAARLTPEPDCRTLDLSYLEDELTAPLALQLLHEHQPTRRLREGIFEKRLSGYDTSVGLVQITTDEQVRENCKRRHRRRFLPR